MALKDLLNSQQVISNQLPGAAKVIFPETTPVNAVAANGIVTFTGTPVANETLTIGTQVYTFKATRAVAGEVTINANNTTQGDNLVTAITADQPEVTAVNAAGAVTITAATKGVAGNLIVLSEAATGTAVTGVTAGKLDGGVDGTVGTKNQVLFDVVSGAGYIFVCIDNNGISDANWRKSQINTVV